MGKLLLLTLNEQEETAIDKIISAISDYIQIEPMQITTASVLSFPGLEIKQNQRRVFQDGHKYLKPFGTWKVKAASQALQM